MEPDQRVSPPGVGAVARNAAGQLPRALPEDVGMRSDALTEIDRLVQQGLDSRQMPGCVVAVGRHGRIVLLKAYGFRRIQPDSEPMTADTVFDLASLTKPIATATSIMILLDRDRLRLDDRVAAHWPQFGTAGKEEITIRQLLMHQGGLIADNALDDYRQGSQVALERICALPCTVKPGTKFIYSDVGFIVLGEIIRRITGQDVHEFSQQHLFQPLGMTQTGYLPATALQQRAAPTEQRDGHWMQGEVHDPRAYALGGIAGHAGLFSCAEDLAIYAQMMLQRGATATPTCCVPPRCTR